MHSPFPHPLVITLPSASRSVGGGNEGVLEGAVLHRALEVVLSRDGARAELLKFMLSTARSLLSLC